MSGRHVYGRAAKIDLGSSSRPIAALAIDEKQFFQVNHDGHAQRLTGLVLLLGWISAAGVCCQR
jgi:hypothetical protein